MPLFKKPSPPTSSPPNFPPPPPPTQEQEFTPLAPLLSRTRTISRENPFADLDLTGGGSQLLNVINSSGDDKVSGKTKKRKGSPAEPKDWTLQLGYGSEGLARNISSQPVSRGESPAYSQSELSYSAESHSGRPSGNSLSQPVGKGSSKNSSQDKSRERARPKSRDRDDKPTTPHGPVLPLVSSTSGVNLTVPGGVNRSGSTVNRTSSSGGKKRPPSISIPVPPSSDPIASTSKTQASHSKSEEPTPFKRSFRSASSHSPSSLLHPADVSGSDYTGSGSNSNSVSHKSRSSMGSAFLTPNNGGNSRNGSGSSKDKTKEAGGESSKGEDWKYKVTEEILNFKPRTTPSQKSASNPASATNTQSTNSSRLAPPPPPLSLQRRPSAPQPRSQPQHQAQARLSFISSSANSGNSNSNTSSVPFPSPVTSRISSMWNARIGTRAAVRGKGRTISRRRSLPSLSSKSGLNIENEDEQEHLQTDPSSASEDDFYDAAEDISIHGRLSNPIEISFSNVFASRPPQDAQEAEGESPVEEEKMIKIFRADRAAVVWDVAVTGGNDGEAGDGEGLPKRWRKTSNKIIVPNPPISPSKIVAFETEDSSSEAEKLGLDLKKDIERNYHSDLAKFPSQPPPNAEFTEKKKEHPLQSQLANQDDSMEIVIPFPISRPKSKLVYDAKADGNVLSASTRELKRQWREERRKNRKEEKAMKEREKGQGGRALAGSLGSLGEVIGGLGSTHAHGGAGRYSRLEGEGEAERQGQAEPRISTTATAGTRRSTVHDVETASEHPSQRHSPTHAAINVEEMESRPSTGATSTSKESWRFLPTWLEWLTRLPPPGYMFLFGFLFFPLWWAGSFYPITSHSGSKEYFGSIYHSPTLRARPPPLTHVVSPSNSQRGWSKEYHGSTPEFRRKGNLGIRGSGRLADWLEESVRVDEVEDGNAFWAQQKAIWVWRLRCRIMTLLSVLVAIPIVTIAILAGVDKSW